MNEIKKLLILLLTFITLGGCSPNTIKNSLSTELEYYSVSVTSSDGGIVNTSGGYYKAGTQIKIRATPEQGYIFSEWMGINSNENPLTIEVVSDHNISAIFTKFD
ncbi:MAG: hypothetical protein ACJ0PW_02000 [Flavobacteriaceae bacterium]